MSGRARVMLGAAIVGACLLAACRGNEGEGNMNEANRRVVRKAWGGGRWFPGDADELKETVDRFLADADPPAVSGRIVAVIAPHAGYVYSGKVAGYAFRALRDNAAAGPAPETAVVLGFSHRGGFPGAAFMDGDALRTPLGEAALDREATDLLTAAGGRLRKDCAPHAGEHSAENEVPFVQAALPGARIVVALIGDHDPATIRELAAALTGLAKRKRIVVVASTDLLHSPDYALVTRTDKQTLETICGMDAAKLLKSWDYGNQVCCGIGPVLTAMHFAAAQGCRKGTLLHYRNSGDDFPESRGNWVVGYGAVAFAAPAAAEN
ncbi:MAG: AmmeMemoRadiSam system protein B [Lentisphaerae bacterium]|nr:AmmeMemoRadiSam system protein B [Lentisphaerota bacterium]